jgi:hypothetical protein
MRDWLTILCVGVLTFGIIGSVWFYSYPHSVVYACSDKESNPADVQILCERITRGQWWSK